MISAKHIWLGFWVGVALLGCQSSSGPATVSCLEPTQTRTWLLGEVDDTFETHPNGSFQFPIQNGTKRSVPLKVRSIGCSCFQLRRGETRLKVGDVIDLGAGQTEILGLHVARPTTDRVADYHFALEYESKTGQPVEVISCQGTLTSVSDLRVNPSLLMAEFSKDTASQAIRFEVTRCARKREVAEQTFVMNGWPTGSEVVSQTPLGEPVEDLTGLWKRAWRVEVKIPKPEIQALAQEFWSIQVSGDETGSANSQVQLMVKSRSGLSGPKLVHFGDVKVGQPATRRIQVIARDEQPFRILGPADSSLGLTIHSDSSDAVNSHWGALTLTPKSEGDFQQVLQVSTDHPEQDNLAVEVRAHVIP